MRTRVTTYTASGRARPSVAGRIRGYRGEATGAIGLAVSEDRGPDMLREGVCAVTMDVAEFARLVAALLADSTAEQAEHLREALRAVLDS